MLDINCQNSRHIPEWIGSHPCVALSYHLKQDGSKGARHAPNSKCGRENAQNTWNYALERLPTESILSVHKIMQHTYLHGHLHIYIIYIYIYSLSFYSYIPDHSCISYHHPPVPFLFCSIHFLILIHAISHLSRLNRSSGLKKNCTMSGYWKHSPSACFVQKSGVNNEGLMAISRKFDYVWLSTTHNWKCTPHKCDINL